MVTKYDVVDRIMNRMIVDPSGCWIWPGACNASGVPVCNAYVDHKARTYTVNRLIWESFNGPLSLRYRLSRTCGTPRCINPAHFACPTAADDLGGETVTSAHARRKLSVLRSQSNAAKRASPPSDAH